MWGNCTSLLITCMCRVNIVLPYPKSRLRLGCFWGRCFCEACDLSGSVRHTLLCCLSGFLVGHEKDLVEYWTWLMCSRVCIFFSLNHSHMVNFLFCYGSLLLMDMQWVFLGKRPIFIKIFLEENFIWQCRLLKLTLSVVCRVLCVTWVKVLSHKPPWTRR